MKQMSRSLVVVVFAFPFLVGCTGQQGSSTPDLGGPSGTITWSASAQKEKPQRGIDQASIWDFLRGGGQARTVATVNNRPLPAAQLLSLQAVAVGDAVSFARQSVRLVHYARGRL